MGNDYLVHLEVRTGERRLDYVELRKLAKIYRKPVSIHLKNSTRVERSRPIEIPVGSRLIP